MKLHHLAGYISLLLISNNEFDSNAGIGCQLCNRHNEFKNNIEYRFDQMKIGITSIFVNDQEIALKFYTEILGFEKKREIPMGEFKWLTVVSPENPDGVELLLEPNDNVAARNYQNAIYNQGIPATTFQVEDLDAEYSHLKDKGVEFHSEPKESPFGYYAVFKDTCGNLIQINQIK